MSKFKASFPIVLIVAITLTSFGASAGQGLLIEEISVLQNERDKILGDSNQILNKIQGFYEVDIATSNLQSLYMAQARETAWEFNFKASTNTNLENASFRFTIATNIEFSDILKEQYILYELYTQFIGSSSAYAFATEADDGYSFRITREEWNSGNFYSAITFREFLTELSFPENIFPDIFGLTFTGGMSNSENFTIFRPEITEFRDFLINKNNIENINKVDDINRIIIDLESRVDRISIAVYVGTTAVVVAGIMLSRINEKDLEYKIETIQNKQGLREEDYDNKELDKIGFGGLFLLGLITVGTTIFVFIF